VSPATRRRLRIALRAAERFLAAFGFSTLVYLTCFDYSTIISGSMSPALQGNDEITGDRVLFEKFTGRFRNPKRWEIHQFHTPEGLTVAKRIVGMPGERISIRNGVLCINGNPLPIPEPLAHLHYYPFGNLAQGKEIDCGGGYFVLGDDSRDSFDSRYEGVLALERFTGRAWLRLGPSGRRGVVE
jgi:signal peptidase I